METVDLNSAMVSSSDIHRSPRIYNSALDSRFKVFCLSDVEMSGDIQAVEVAYSSGVIRSFRMSFANFYVPGTGFRLHSGSPKRPMRKASHSMGSRRPQHL